MARKPSITRAEVSCQRDRGKLVRGEDSASCHQPQLASRVRYPAYHRLNADSVQCRRRADIGKFAAASLGTFATLSARSGHRGDLSRCPRISNVKELTDGSSQICQSSCFKSDARPIDWAADAGFIRRETPIPSHSVGPGPELRTAFATVLRWVSSVGGVDD